MKLYRCVYQMGVETALEYRANMVLTLLSTIFPIIIQTFLWNYLYGNGDAGAMTGYSYTEIIVYTLLAGLVSKLVITGFEYQINEDIKDGGLNKYLIRPSHRPASYKIPLQSHRHPTASSHARQPRFSFSPGFLPPRNAGKIRPLTAK